MSLPRLALPRSRKLKLLMLVGMVALPALTLAGTGIWLTLRVARQVETESARYNAYLAEKVTEAFERELLDQVRNALLPAETAAHEGGGPDAIVRALATRARLFEAPHYVPLEQLENLSLVTVDGQVLVYGDDPTHRRQHPFAAMLINGPDGTPVGAGGWWFNPRAFLVTHLRAVVVDRLPASPRMYGGFESTRHLGVQVFDAQGNEVAHVREAGNPRTARRAPLGGPFEGFSVTVSATRNSPVSVASHVVFVEVIFIALLAVVLLGATAIGVRYILRQIELVQIKSGFVSNVTHELKTPIAVIKLAVETLEMGRFRSEEEREKYLRTIQRESDRLAQLVDNILDFSRLEAGQQVLRFAAVNVSELVQTALESFRLRLEDAGFKLDVQVAAPLPRVRGDARALQHCLLNLLDNAVKYSRERKEIRVSAVAKDGMVGVSVSDRGIGIEAEHRERIFEKFVRVQTGLVHDVKGAGLGLSLVELIVRAHHGRVEVSSTLGEGSTFTIWLPVWDEAQDSPRSA